MNAPDEAVRTTDRLPIVAILADSRYPEYTMKTIQYALLTLTALAVTALFGALAVHVTSLIRTTWPVVDLHGLAMRFGENGLVLILFAISLTGIVLRLALEGARSSRPTALPKPSK
jgi:hypothetical protein